MCDLALGVRRGGSGGRRNGPALYAGLPYQRRPVALLAVSAAGIVDETIGHCRLHAIADRSAVPGRRLLIAAALGISALRITALLAPGLTAVAGERIALQRLLTAAALAALLLARLITTLTLLTCSPGLRIAFATEIAELIAQLREVIHGAVEVGFLRTLLRRAQRMLGVADLLSELLQVAGESRLLPIVKTAAAKLIGAALQACAEIGLIGIFEAPRSLPEAPGWVGARSRAAVRTFCWSCENSSETCWRSFTMRSRVAAEGYSGVLPAALAALRRATSARTSSACFFCCSASVSASGHRAEPARGILLLHSA